MIFRRVENRLQVIAFPKLKKCMKLLYIQNGIIRISFETFCFSHCKVSCDSQCCVKICGGDNHCNFNIDTHGHISDSDEEQIGKL